MWFWRKKKNNNNIKILTSDQPEWIVFSWRRSRTKESVSPITQCANALSAHYRWAPEGSWSQIHPTLEENTQIPGRWTRQNSSPCDVVALCLQTTFSSTKNHIYTSCSRKIQSPSQKVILSVCFNKREDTHQEGGIVSAGRN